MVMLNASQRGMLYGLFSLMLIDFIKFTIEALECILGAFEDLLLLC
jgi:hypothetical protein